MAMQQFDNDRVKALGVQIAQSVQQTMRQAMTVLAEVATGKYMRATTRLQAATWRPHDTMLTIRSGRLARSLLQENHPETVAPRVMVDGLTIIGQLGSKVPYAARHEYGGTFPVTPRQRRFFWRQYYEGRGDMWKAMALKKAITTPARPYLRPAFTDEETLRAIAEMFAEDIRRFIARGSQS